MTNKQFGFWQKWLTWANVLTLMVGILVAFAGNSTLFEVYNEYTREVFFQGNPIEGDILRFKKWLFGIIGGTIVGFHLLMIMISENALKKKEIWSYKALWLGLVSWFIIDSSISFYYGAIYNIVIINIVALALIGLPLVMTRNEFKRRKGASEFKNISGRYRKQPVYIACRSILGCLLFLKFLYETTALLLSKLCWGIICRTP